MAASQGGDRTIDLHGEAAAQAVATLAEATLHQDGQIILTGDDGQQGNVAFYFYGITVSLSSSINQLSCSLSISSVWDGYHSSVHVSDCGD